MFWHLVPPDVRCSPYARREGVEHSNWNAAKLKLKSVIILNFSITVHHDDGYKNSFAIVGIHEMADVLKKLR